MGERLDGEVGVGAQQGAGDGDRRRRGGKGGDRDAVLEALHQLLEHEHRAGDRRIEGGSEAGAGAGCH